MMKCMKKRLQKTVAITLSAVILSYTTLPAAAYAAPPPPPPGPHDMHHHDHGGKMNTTAAIIGLALTIGIMAWANNQFKYKIPSDPKAYATYKNSFVSTLNSQERFVYEDMSNRPAGEYKFACTNRETAKTIKKLCKKLPQDFKYTSTTSMKEADGTKTKYITFQRLRANSFGNIKATPTTGTFAEAL